MIFVEDQSTSEQACFLKELKQVFSNCSFFYLKSTSIETQIILGNNYFYTWLLQKLRKVPEMYIKLYFQQKIVRYSL